MSKARKSTGSIIMERKTLKENWRQNVLRQLWSKADSSPAYYTDLMFRCVDGSILAHKFWLSNSCSTLGKALENIHTCLEEFIVVLVPDFSIKIVRKFLKLFYTGSVNLSDLSELEDIKEFGCRQLGLSMGFDQLKFTKVDAEEVDFQSPNLDPKSVPQSNLVTPKRVCRPNLSGNFLKEPSRGSVSLSMSTQATPLKRISLSYEDPSESSNSSLAQSTQTKYTPKPKKFCSPKTTLKQNPKQASQVIETPDQNEDVQILEEDQDNDDGQIQTNNILSPEVQNDDEDINSEDDEEDGNEAELVVESNGNEIKKEISSGRVRKIRMNRLACTFCPKLFNKEKCLQRHVRKAHKGEGSCKKPEGTVLPTTHSCEFCGKAFSLKINLKKHVENVHRDVEQADVEVPAIECMICQMKFSSDGNLRIHMTKTHKIPDGMDIFS